MRAIDQALVDEVWRELTAYPPAQIRAEANAFLASQPHVAAYAASVTSGLDADVRQAALGLGFLLFKVLEAALGQPLPPLAEERIRLAHEATEARLVRAADGAGAAPAGDGGETDRLIAAILTAFYQGDPGAYDEGVQDILALLLRTLAEAAEVGRSEA